MGMWKEVVAAYPWAAASQKVHFGPPATADQLRQIEAEFGLTLPPDLRALLAEANGVEGTYYRVAAESEFGGGDFMLSTALIAEYTRDLRKEEVYKVDCDGHPQPVDSFLVISIALGNGDLYAYALGDVDGYRAGDIVHWDHETNQRSLAAADLRSFITDGNPGIR